MNSSLLNSEDRNSAVLIVDDYPAMRRMMRGYLMQLGFENITEVCDGSEALQHVQEREFQLVLTDWNMPDMSGDELAGHIRNSSSMRSVPIVMFAPHSRCPALEKSARTEDIRFVGSPFTFEHFGELIRDVLKVFERNNPL